jgi:phosphomannomutase/phosphoglucomutase
MPVPAALTTHWRSVTQIWAEWRALFILVGTLFILAGAGSYFWERYTAGSVAQREDAAVSAVERMASDLGQRLQQGWRTLPGVKNRAELARLLQTAPPGMVAQREAALAAQNSHVRLARLLPSGTNRVDYSSTPPFSYAALDMLRRSERSGSAPTSQVLLSGQDQHIAVVHRLEKRDGTLVGHLWLALDTAFLNEIVASVPFPAGYWELWQPVGNRGARKLLATGNSGFQQNTPVLHREIPNTAWSLAYWHPQTGPQASGTHPRVLLWGGAGMVALVFAAAFVFQQHKRTRQAPRIALAAQVDPVVEPTSKEVTMEQTASLERKENTILEQNMSSLGAEQTPPAPRDIGASETEPLASPAPIPLSSEIFRAYDIRGVVSKTLTPEIVHELGRAIGSEMYEQAEQTLVVGYDGRNSSQALVEALIEGVCASGRDVIGIGCVPTPVLYFATHYLETTCGVIVTGSHNPPEYNGLKIMLAGETLFGERISALRSRVEKGRLVQGQGNLQHMDVVDEYVREVADEVPVTLGHPFRIVVDCGNGVAGQVAPKLYRALGHDVIELYCQVDGNFPHHHPDPSQPENLSDLIAAVREHQADLGLAFDGDGDRLGVVDGQGQIVWPDRQMMLLARDILARHPGAAVVYDVKCSRHLPELIERLGGKPIMWKSGHSYIKYKMLETGALLAGELTGHLFLKDRWYGFDDALYAGARLLEILVNSGRAPDELFQELPNSFTTPELRLDIPENRHFELMERLVAARPFPDATLQTMDGLRASYADAWGLVRASNTTPSLVFRFEGDNEQALRRVQDRFRQVLREIEPGLSLPF